MMMTIEQIKGKLKSISRKENADARILLRIFMMERLLERISTSQYKDNFIVKGGILVTSLVGVNMRSTMDMDITIKSIQLSVDTIYKIIDDICKIDLVDNVTFKIDNVQSVMEDKEYPGIRFSITGNMGKLSSPIKIDFSTGDIITPKEVSYKYKLLIEDRTIELWSYNIETILAEKIDTILNKGIQNTRIRDFYDIYIINTLYKTKIDSDILKKAYINTSSFRCHEYTKEEIEKILNNIFVSKELKELWFNYSKKYEYAKDIDFSSVIASIYNIIDIIL